MVKSGFASFLFALLAAMPGQAMAQTTDFARSLAYCEKYEGSIDAKRYADVAASMQTNGEYRGVAEELAYKRKNRRQCLESAKQRAAGNPAVANQFSALIAANDKTLADRFEVARQEFEANAVNYLDPASYFGEPKLGPYKAALASAPRTPTLQGSCGAFDFSFVPVERSAVDAARARHEAYMKCLDKFQDEASRIYVTQFLSFNTAAPRMAGSFRYTCSQWKRPNCIPDAKWKQFGGELFTQKNRALVEAAEKRLDAESKASYATGRKISEWVRELSGRIEAHNRS